MARRSQVAKKPGFQIEGILVGEANQAVGGTEAGREFAAEQVCDLPDGADAVCHMILVGNRERIETEGGELFSPDPVFAEDLAEFELQLWKVVWRPGSTSRACHAGAIALVPQAGLFGAPGGDRLEDLVLTDVIDDFAIGENGTQQQIGFGVVGVAENALDCIGLIPAEFEAENSIGSTVQKLAEIIAEIGGGVAEEGLAGIAEFALKIFGGGSKSGESEVLAEQRAAAADGKHDDVGDRSERGMVGCDPGGMVREYVDGGAGHSSLFYQLRRPQASSMARRAIALKPPDAQGLR
jgi:hypothetical protein